MTRDPHVSAARRGWQEHVGDGIRRDHRVSCSRSGDRRPRGRCSCPWSWWRPTARGRRRERAAPFFGTLAEARAAKRREQVAAADRRIAARHGLERRPVEGEQCVFEYFTRWLRRSEHRLAPGTLYDRATAYRKYLHATFGRLRVIDVTAQTVEDWLHDSIADGSRYWPLRSAFFTLQAMLGDAARKGHISWNPCVAVDFPAVPERTRRDFLTADEYRRLVAACVTSTERLYVGLAGEAALRRGEICGLKSGDLVLDANPGPTLKLSNNIVRVTGRGLAERPPKGGKARTVALTPTLAALLREHVAAHAPLPGDYLFTSPVDGGAVKPD